MTFERRPRGHAQIPLSPSIRDAHTWVTQTYQFIGRENGWVVTCKRLGIDAWS
jgi:hypothetical protein